MKPYAPRPWQTTLIALLAIPLIGVLDHLAGQDVFFATVYLVPIVVVAWYDGRSAALLLAVVSGASTYLANYYFVDLPPTGPLVALWNALSRLVIFSILGLVVAALKSTLEEQGRLAAIVSESADAIIGLDLQGRITSWNVGAERLFQAGAPDMIGRRISDLFPTARVEDWRDAYARALAGGELETVEALRVQPDGVETHASLVLSPVRDARGALVGLSVIARDMTPRVLAERALQHANGELERSNHDLEAFAHVVSHDLREPLRMVASYIALLGQRHGDQLDEQARGFVRASVQGCERMQRMLDALLAYARVGPGGAELQPVDTDAVLDEAIANLDLALREAGGHIVREPLPPVIGDRMQLLQVFQNLVGNAIKYHQPGTPPRVEIGASRVGAEARIHVRDNGRGIAQRDQRRIFQLFQRADAPGQAEGSGIGLAIVKRIVERHGGRIQVESEPDRGSTFTFTLRLAPDALAIV